MRLNGKSAPTVLGMAASRMAAHKRAGYWLLGLFVLLVVLFAFTASAWATTFSNPVDADYSHIDNSVYLSQADFPDGAAAAVLAGSESYADALTATVLAKAAGGPLLLTSASSLSTQVQKELVRLKVKKVFLVGLSGLAASIKTATGLTSDQVVDLAGTDTAQRAARVASEIKTVTGKTPARVFILPSDVYGSSTAGAAIAAANGWPILLTPQAGPFPAVSATAITDLGVKAGVRVDTNATVPGLTIEKTIYTGDDAASRYTEALNMAEYAVGQGWATYAHVAIGEERITSGYTANFPDNVLLASHISREDGAYLLVRCNGLPSNVATLLKQHGKAIESVDFMRPDYNQVLSGVWDFETIRQVKKLNSPRVTGLSKTSGPLAGGGALTVAGTGFTGATTVRVGKTDLPEGSWKATSDTSLTINSMPAATGQGAVEVFVGNYWNLNPSNPKDTYLYLPSGATELPGMKAVREAVKYLGIPYIWAGSRPDPGFDCSGFTMYVFSKIGISLPHYSRSQATMGIPVDREDLLPGDLVFFGSPIGHVGIYVGNGLMINSPRSGDLVTIEDVFRSNYTSARRLISPPYTKVEDTSTLLAYTGVWGNTSTTSASGGSYSYSDDANGASVTVTFKGTYLQWIAKKSPAYGLASVAIDGKPAGTVNLYSSGTSYKQKVWDTDVLPEGTHTVTITRTGTSSGGGTNIGLDVFEILGTPMQAHPVGVASRFQDTDSRILWTGLWDNVASGSASGACLRSISKAGSASVTFDGTSVSLLGMTGPNYGIAKFTVDGKDAGTADFYSSVTAYARTVWTSNTLTDGRHTVAVEWTGEKNASSKGTAISVDAFDIMGTPVKPSGLTRYEQTDSKLVWVPSAWEQFSTGNASFGSYARARSGSSVTVTFTGTYLSWVATAGTTLTKATVSLDNGPMQTVDLARSAVAYQQSVWATGVLSSGTHTVKISWAGGTATSKFISVDAFDVIGSLGTGTPPPPPATTTRYENTNGMIAYVGNWIPFPVSSASGGSYTYLDSTGKVLMSFTGTRLDLIATTGLTMGKGKVTVDGVDKGTIDFSSGTTKRQQNVWSTGTLSSGSHTVVVSWTGQAGSYGRTRINLDAVEIVGSLSQASSDPPPPVTPPPVTPPPTTTTRYEDTDRNVLYTGVWQHQRADSASNDCFHYINKTGSVKITFNGTYLSWIAKKSDQYGKAKVTVDGANAAIVDLYSAQTTYGKSVWNTGVLAAGTHTVTIEWTGTKNSSAKATNIGLDAFDIKGTPVTPQGLVRYEQTASPLAFVPSAWEQFSKTVASGGSYARAKAGSSVTVTFSGTYLSWVATTGTTLTMAKVSLDGGAAQLVDLSRVTALYQQSVWATGVLPSGTHTVKITWAGGSATTRFISVDAFDLIGTLK